MGKRRSWLIASYPEAELATQVILPLLGQTMEEGTITKWLKKEGEPVERGEPLVEVMTDKANMEVESPTSGILRKILAPEDAVVPVKAPIAIIGSADEPIDGLVGMIQPGAAAVEGGAPSLPAEEPPTRPAPASAGGRVFATPRARKVAAERGIDITLLAGGGSGPGGRIVEEDVLAFATRAGARSRATPLATKVAEDIGLDLARVTGTGPGGKVRRDDVLQAAAPKAEREPIGRIIPFSGLRRAIAQNVALSVRTAPHVTLVSEVDMASCTEMRERLMDDHQKRYGVRLGLTALIVRAAALAILDNPIVNTSLIEDAIVIHDEINVGIAVAFDDGLVVPVIRNADRKLPHEIGKEIRALAAKARAGNLQADEMKGGTFTVTSLGSYGVDVFNPIINPPESAILGVCRIVERPVVVGGTVQPRPMMNLCLSFDHRVMDGTPAARYLARVKELLESPHMLVREAGG